MPTYPGWGGKIFDRQDFLQGRLPAWPPPGSSPMYSPLQTQVSQLPLAQPSPTYSSSMGGGATTSFVFVTMPAVSSSAPVIKSSTWYNANTLIRKPKLLLVVMDLPLAIYPKLYYDPSVGATPPYGNLVYPPPSATFAATSNPWYDWLATFDSAMQTFASECLLQTNGRVLATYINVAYDTRDAALASGLDITVEHFHNPFASVTAQEFQTPPSQYPQINGCPEFPYALSSSVAVDSDVLLILLGFPGAPSGFIQPGSPPCLFGFSATDPSICVANGGGAGSYSSEQPSWINLAMQPGVISGLGGPASVLDQHINMPQPYAASAAAAWRTQKITPTALCYGTPQVPGAESFASFWMSTPGNGQSTGSWASDTSASWGYLAEIAQAAGLQYTYQGDGTNLGPNDLIAIAKQFWNLP